MSARVVRKINELLASSDPEADVLVVGTALTDEEVDEYLGIFRSNESQGTKSVSYLVHGIPGTQNYSFFDLNNLPSNYRAEVTFSNDQGEVLSRSQWSGNLGNSAQPLDV